MFPNFLEITFPSPAPRDYPIGDSWPKIEIAWSNDLGITDSQDIPIDSGLNGPLAHYVSKLVARKLLSKKLYVKNLSDDLELYENFFKGVDRSFELIDLNELFRDKPENLYQSPNVVAVPGIAKRTVENYIALYLKLKAMPVFIDFEASSLNPDSYPIEVAWSTPDGARESHLISPYTVASWTDWSREAQALHGLSRNRLAQEGKPVFWVAERMNEALKGSVLLTNNFEYDLDWCEKLFEAAGNKMQFKLGDAWRVFSLNLNLQPSLEQVLLDKPVSREQIKQELQKISTLAWQQVKGHQHRASVDVQQLQMMWQIIKKQYNAFPEEY